MTLTTNWTEAYEAIQRAQTILVVTHVSPDGDAIGSLLGAANALRALGKHVDTAVDGGVPPFLDFLPNAHLVIDTLNAGAWDVMLSVDASDEERTGAAGAYGRAHSQTVINLDHHATNTGFGQIHLVSPQAASATEVLFEWFTRVGVPIGIDSAVPLMTGLITDTLGFRTSATTPRTLEIAQELMRRGASLTELIARTLETMAYTTLKLWTRALNDLSLERGVVWVSLTLDDYARAETDDDAGLSGFLVRIKEAVVSVVFTEKPEGKVNISMRAKHGYDVAQVALALGGGGHKPAAGATVSGTLDEVRARVLPMLFDVVQQGNPN